MNPLPSPLGTGEIVAWWLDEEIYRATWDSGMGAARFGGRWNLPGMHAVYCSLDPATAIIEVAVHAGFDELDRARHLLTSITLIDPVRVHVVDSLDVPNPNWLRPGHASVNQQRFGTELIRRHGMLEIPSAVSSKSWNLVFRAGAAAGLYALRTQERFALDTRLVR